MRLSRSLAVPFCSNLLCIRNCLPQGDDYSDPSVTLVPRGHDLDMVSRGYDRIRNWLLHSSWLRRGIIFGLLCSARTELCHPFLDLSDMISFPVLGPSDLFKLGRQELEIGLYDSRNFPKSLELAPEQLWEDYHFACSLAHQASQCSDCFKDQRTCVVQC